MAKHLINISPYLLYCICQDIQVSDNWRKFAILINLSPKELKLIEMRSDKTMFEAEHVLRLWLPRSPTADNLADVLCRLKLENPLVKLKDHVTNLHYEKLMKKLESKRDFYLNQPGQDINFHEFDQPPEMELANNLTGPPIEVTRSSNQNVDENSFCRSPLITNTLPEISVPGVSTTEALKGIVTFFESILKIRTMEFYKTEFECDDISTRIDEGQFSITYHKKLRGNTFYVESFPLERLSESVKYQKQLYNIIWFLSNFKLFSLPILTGYCLMESSLSLVYLSREMVSLFKILHHSSEIITMARRLKILQEIGQVLTFLHSCRPFEAYHGQVTTDNVLIGGDFILLSGFKNFYSNNPDYLQGMEKITKSKTKTKDFKRQDVLQYLELVCEIWWNVPPYKKKFTNETLISSINKTMTNPKVKYDGWNEDIHGKVCKLILYHSDEHNLWNISAIVDDLERLQSAT